MGSSLRVLFICTGNYYRSRFAEALFNHHARRVGLNWRAFSRGLAIHLADGMGGELSRNVQRRLGELAISADCCGAKRVSLNEVDLYGADRIIAMDVEEHLPMLQKQFPQWVERVEFWNSRDLQWESVESCMSKIEHAVPALVCALLSGVDAVNKPSYSGLV